MELKTDKMIARKEDGVGWIIFNNPERRNATSLEMWEATETILDAFEHDPEIRVVIMKGAGDKSFVSGADISQFEEKRADAEAAAAYSKTSESAKRKMAELSKPLIAMIRGFCLGGGLGLAMKADMRIASDDSQFGIPAARLGIAYGFDSLKALVDLVGPAFAKEILFTGRRLSADEALRIGLVNQVVPVASLEEKVMEYARSIAENAPLSILSSKVTIDQVIKDPEERDTARISELSRACFDSQDYVEGRRAFMEKRKPAFAGR